MMACSDSPGYVQGPENADEGRKERLAGNQQGLPEPKPQAGDYYADITKVQHVPPAPGPRVERQPGQQPDHRRPPHDGKCCCAGEDEAHNRNAEWPQRIIGSNMDLGEFSR